MITRVLSLMRGADAGAARSADPALDVNAYAVAEDVEVTLVLKDQGVQLGVAETSAAPEAIVGIDVPVAEPETDITALLSSGVPVLAVRTDLQARGLGPEDLLDGIEVVEEARLAELIVEHDVTLTTTS